MKKIYNLVLILFLSISANAQTVNIPDSAFLYTLTSNSSIDTSGDGQIQVGEALIPTYLSIQSQPIYDMTGIEAFTNLTELRAFYNEFSSIDLTSNVNLETLRIGYNNNFSSINISGLTSLDFLQMGSTPALSALDVSTNTGLTIISIQTSGISSFDVSNNTNLNTLTFQSSPLDTIDVSANTLLTRLNLYANAIDDIDLSNNTALEELALSNNLFTTVDLSQNVNLEYLFLENNDFTQLDITNNPELIRLYIYNNYLSTLDLSNNTKIDEFYANSNSFTSIDVSSIDSLRNFRINDNDLTSLDVSNNFKLRSLSANDNQLITISDLSLNALLYYLLLDDNQLTSLDLSGNPALSDQVFVNDNNLSYLNMANGNNSNLYYFNASNNPNLTCIQIDSGYTPLPIVQQGPGAGFWMIDTPQMSYSTYCEPLVNVVLVASITVQGENGVSTISTSGGTLQMEAEVLPANADDATYTWSVNNLTGAATIDANGLLTASADGTVEVVATANDTSGVTGTKIITISNQTVGINDLTFENLSVYPNPTNDILNIKVDEALSSIDIMDITGKVVKTFPANSAQLNIAELENGIYFLELANESNKSVVKVIKK